MSQVNFNQQPSFGMAFRFQEGGAKRMAKAFKEIPDEARKLVKEQLNNKDVDTIVTETDIRIEPKIYQKELLPFLHQEQINNIKSMNAEYGYTLCRMEPFTDAKIVLDRVEFRDAATLSDKVQARINSIKDEAMNVDELAKELEKLAE